MRTIKFRGKDKKTNTWVYGDLAYCKFGVEHAHMIVKHGVHGGMVWCYDRFRVKPETIGQFTGFFDRNQKEIYEGDVVEWNKDNKKYVVEYLQGIFFAFPCGLAPCEGYPLCSLYHGGSNCTVVDNIYDNPLATK